MRISFSLAVLNGAIETGYLCAHLVKLGNARFLTIRSAIIGTRSARQSTRATKLLARAISFHFI